jgi:hypothetical protein
MEPLQNKYILSGIMIIKRKRIVMIFQILKY